MSYMIYRALDSNGDYTLGKNLHGFLFDAAAVAQAVKTNLKLLQGEWWESMATGLPLFQSILGQSGTPDHLKAVDLLIQQRILKTQGVASISAYQSTLDASVRQLTVTVTIATITGQTATVGVSF